jgi:hypothetical protein
VERCSSSIAVVVAVAVAAAVVVVVVVVVVVGGGDWVSRATRLARYTAPRRWPARLTAQTHYYVVLLIEDHYLPNAHLLRLPREGGSLGHHRLIGR